MNNQQLRRYLDGIEIDHEEKLTVPGLSILKSHGIFARKLEDSLSIQSNHVTGALQVSDPETAIEDVFRFFGGRPFSWLIDSGAESTIISEVLRRRGMVEKEQYSGMYRSLTNLPEYKVNQEISIIDVSDQGEIETLVDITCEVWGIKDGATRQTMVKERLNYLETQGRRGGFCLAYHGAFPVGYARYRISSDNVAVYLTGAGVLRNFRNRSVFTTLLRYRELLAKESGCSLAVVKAKSDTSEPIFRKLGYQTIGKFILLAKEN